MTTTHYIATAISCALVGAALAQIVTIVRAATRVAVKAADATRNATQRTIQVTTCKVRDTRNAVYMAATRRSRRIKELESTVSKLGWQLATQQMHLSTAQRQIETLESVDRTSPAGDNATAKLSHDLLTERINSVDERVERYREQASRVDTLVDTVATMQVQLNAMAAVERTSPAGDQQVVAVATVDVPAFAEGDDDDLPPDTPPPVVASVPSFADADTVIANAETTVVNVETGPNDALGLLKAELAKWPDGSVMPYDVTDELCPDDLIQAAVESSVSIYDESKGIVYSTNTGSIVRVKELYDDGDDDDDAPHDQYTAETPLECSEIKVSKLRRVLETGPFVTFSCPDGVVIAHSRFAKAEIGVGVKSDDVFTVLTENIKESLVKRKTVYLKRINDGACKFVDDYIVPVSNSSMDELTLPDDVFELNMAAVRQVFHAAGKNDVRYFLNGVLVESNDDGQVRLAATDGHRMVVTDWMDGDGVPPVDRAILPRDVVWSALRTKAKTNRIAITDKAAFAIRDGFIHREYFVDGHFPHIDRLIPKDVAVVGTHGAVNVLTTTERALAEKKRLCKKHGLLNHVDGRFDVIKCQAAVRGRVDLDGDYTEDEYSWCAFNLKYICDAAAGFDPNSALEFAWPIKDGEIERNILRITGPNATALVMPLRA